MSNIQPEMKDSLLNIDGRIATLSFNRDDVRNALTGTHLVRDICNTVDWINNNSEINCLVITGNGKAFSSGGNVKDMRNKTGMFAGSPKEIEESYRTGIQQMSLAMNRLEVPAIAAINGAAIGAGFDLTCMCDIRIGCPDSRFGETFINLGIIPGDGGAFFLQRLIGYQRAAELTLTGRIIDADEALHYGILLEVVASDKLLSRSAELAQVLAAKPPYALRKTKQLMKKAQQMELSAFLDLCAEVQSSCHQSTDHMLALDAFLDKKDVTFTGR